MELLATIARLTENPELRLNLEKRGKRYRVRYCRRDGVGGRLGIAVPITLVDEARRLVSQSQQRQVRFGESRRRAKKVRMDQAQELRSRLDELARRMIAACPGGRVLRSRIKRGFKNAAALGLEALEAYVAERPWECRGGNPSRLQKL